MKIPDGYRVLKSYETVSENGAAPPPPEAARNYRKKLRNELKSLGVGENEQCKMVMILAPECLPDFGLWGQRTYRHVVAISAAGMRIRVEKRSVNPDGTRLRSFQ